MKSQLTFGLERRFVSADDPKKEEKINSVTNSSPPCRIFRKGYV